MTATTVTALPLRERPAWRVARRPANCSLVELLAAVIGGARQLESAHKLLAHFGSLRALSQASAAELMAVEGLGPGRAAALLAAFELGRRLGALQEGDSPLVQSPEDAAALLLYDLQRLEQEHLFVVLLDTRHRVLGEPVEIYRGSLNTSVVRVGEVLRPAVRANAAAVVVAHNHPSGDPSPSPEDVALTRALVAAGKLLDIEVLDHLIIGRARFTSLRARGLGFDGS